MLSTLQISLKHAKRLVSYRNSRLFSLAATEPDTLPVIPPTMTSIKEQLSLYKPYFPHLQETQWERMEALCNEIIKWNEKVNLVSRKDINKLVEAHIIPSLTICLLKNKDDNTTSVLQYKKVVDVGTGGGFPGLPLAIACPETHFTLVDSNNKKMKIVSEIIDHLQIYNSTVLCTRAEDFTSYKLGYDYILGRSVASIPKFLTHSSHLITSSKKVPELSKNLEINGGLLYIKGGEFSAELKEANISYWRSIPMKNLLPSLPSDKQILYIPTKEIQTFKQRLDLTSKK